MEQHQQTCDRLAGLLADQRGAETMSALQRLARASRGPGGGREQARVPKAGRPRPVGPWQVVATPTGPGLRRRASMPLPESRLWASDGDVPGKGDATRVVLVGESVARGYLLDPVFNPAMALRHYLSLAPRPYQCVDLARNAIQMHGLRQIAAMTPLLDTDVLVVFAGNNWAWMATATELPGLEYPAGLADVLRRAGYPGVRDAVLNEAVLPQVGAFLADLLRLRAEAGLRLVVVVPEFNLAGWSPLAADEAEVPMLPEPAMLAWCQLRSDALAALGRGDGAAVRAATAEMTRLDEGLSPVPGHLLGRALEAAGEHEAAREAYERSRDSVCGLPVRHSSGVPGPVQDLLRNFCQANDVDCVDVPRLFAGTDLTALPSPAHFLDYCHLSDTGIAVVMAEVAAVITGQRADWRDQHATLVSDWQRAVALVLAATANSFSGQPASLVRGYLRQAVDACPRILELMAALARIADRPGGPMWSGTDFAEITREPHAASNLALVGGSRPDRSRLWSLRESLAEFAPAPVAEQAGAEQAGPDGGAGGPQELLDIGSASLGLATVANNTEPRCYLQANTMTTELRLILAAPAGGVLRLTHRRREGRPEAAVVRVNGARMGEFVSAASWTTSQVAVPGAATRAGLNVVEIAWPGPAVSWRTRVSEDASALARGQHPYVLAIFGELYSVVFCPGGEAGEPGVTPAGQDRPATAGRRRGTG